MPLFTTHAAKTNLSRLIRQALNGEEVIIARGSQPSDPGTVAPAGDSSSPRYSYAHLSCSPSRAALLWYA